MDETRSSECRLPMRRLCVRLFASPLRQPSLLHNIVGTYPTRTAAAVCLCSSLRLRAMTTVAADSGPTPSMDVEPHQAAPHQAAEASADDSTTTHKRKQRASLPASFSTECALQLRDRRLQLQSHQAVTALLASHGIQCEQVLKRGDRPDAFVVFADSEQRQRAKETLQAAKTEDGKPLFRHLTDIDRWVSRAEQQEKSKKPKRAPAASDSSPATDSDDNTTDPPQSAGPQSILDVVTPYHALPYPTQLKRKLRAAAASLKQATRVIRSLDPNFTPLHFENRHNADILCDLHPTVPAPQLTAYRNKCEFSCGRSRAGDRQCGFLLGRYVEGQVHVEAVDECVNVSEQAKKVAASFTQYMRSSPWEVYEKANHTGVWRLLTVRDNRQGEVMVIVQLDHSTLTDCDKSAVDKSLIDHFAAHCPVQSLWVQHWSGISNAAVTSEAPPMLLSGAATIVEQLSGHSFHISPSSFFQVNTQAAELLYSIVADYAQLQPPAILLDVCCGTGTIGQVVGGGKEGVRVVGLELVEAACEDAAVNAQHNGMTNCSYIAGKAEDTLTHSFLRSLQPPRLAKSTEPSAAQPLNVVAVVDPPRGGLHGSVTRVLRECDELRRLVYVSCNPKSLADNLVTLCQRESKRVKGRPFVAQKAVAVDLFPHTDHCEMVVLLERE